MLTTHCDGKTRGFSRRTFPQRANWWKCQPSRCPAWTSVRKMGDFRAGRGNVERWRESRSSRVERPAAGQACASVSAVRDGRASGPLLVPPHGVRNLLTDADPYRAVKFANLARGEFERRQAAQVAGRQ